MRNLFAKIVDVKPNELHALVLAFVFNFVVLGGYYVIRPIRDEIGADRGVENLPWMYTGTLTGMLIANALYATIVARMSRRRFIPIAYRFAIANLFVFFLLMRWMPAAQERTILAPIFFIWVSVFNLFATTMFWSFMADVFTPDQAKRLFGFIAVGGSIGGIVGGCRAMCAPISWRFSGGRRAKRATNRRQILGGRDAYRSISLLTCSRRLSDDLHAHEHVGIFSTI